ncbi:radical SAM protein with 4Fe4S-binding SPASM domain [Methanolinea mesophila]|uniref:radical SAM/SPASM domain-containing protein n=1 Tax=Methanolinea mesophila TaxID=547055 RepID=UPI001AE19510|nr:radical SAM protein [Methanolinea mesophila]MBP1927916.1 radical SAM protein with 4Fe4S-binding SPASM domain [Methanolinea mesophila]
MNRITQMIHGSGTVSEVIKHRSAPFGEIPSRYLAFSKVDAPVVFWNLTTRCNLSCLHCYNSSGPRAGTALELGTNEAMHVIDDLAGMGVPLILLSGGEPLLRDDFWELAGHARAKGIKLALSTNGTLITPRVAARLKETGIEYAGVSIDGPGPEVHDRQRNVPGSFDRAVQGIRNCLDADLKCGIRFTATRENVSGLEEVLRMARDLGVPRFCLYWLVPSGRGRELANGSQLTPGEAKSALELLYLWARMLEPGEMEILTVDAPQDLVHILQRMDEDNEGESGHARTLARCMGAGCSAGRRVANIDHLGNVYPCQFAQEEGFLIGNVRERPFSTLWRDEENPVLGIFRNNANILTGKCRGCPSVDTCGGGCRVRAYHETGQIGGDDPLCWYL